MIRARRIASEEGLQMKIGDVEFQGDGTKAIFYYIADERVDFRRLIKLFAAEFCVRIEMRQFGARQEAGLIGGIGGVRTGVVLQQVDGRFQFRHHTGGKDPGPLPESTETRRTVFQAKMLHRLRNARIHGCPEGYPPGEPSR